MLLQFKIGIGSNLRNYPCHTWNDGIFGKEHLPLQKVNPTPHRIACFICRHFQFHLFHFMSLHYLLFSIKYLSIAPVADWFLSWPWVLLNREIWVCKSHTHITSFHNQDVPSLTDGINDDLIVVDEGVLRCWQGWLDWLPPRSYD